MRLATRILAVAAVVALAVVLGMVALNAFSGDGGEASPGSADSDGEGLLTLLPAIQQPGNEPAAPAEEWFLTARFTPARADAAVLLQRKDGDSWRTVAVSQQNANGKADFVARPTDEPRQAVRFRATVLEPDGSPGLTSNEVSTEEWSTVFEDLFAGDTLDTSKWAYRQVGIYNESGRRCSTSDEEAVKVAGGTLKLQVMEDPDRVYETCWTDRGSFDYYVNGHVATEGVWGFKYGVAAARVKFPEGRGQHGAFWLQRAGDVPQIPGEPARSGAEIDVAEYFGEGFPGGGFASFIYYLNIENETEKVGGVWPRATQQLPPGDDWWRSYHVFSLEWKPNEYVFRVDGREIFRTRKGVSAVEQFLILSLLSSDWELPRLDEDALPTTMEVDWVRVWQRQGES